jgi:hypothetical protein
MTARRFTMAGIGAVLAAVVLVALLHCVSEETTTRPAQVTAVSQTGPAASVTTSVSSEEGYSRPEAQMSYDSGWSAASHGVQIKLATDKRVYRRDEPIELVLTYRNADSGLWVLRMGPDSRPPPGYQFDDSPLYDLSTLTVTQIGAPEEWKLTPVQSNMFHVLGDLERLDPGGVRSAYGRLTTWAWASRNARTANRDKPLAHGLAPGKYSLTGHCQQPEEFELRVGDHRGEEALASLRQFFLGADTSIEAFQGHHFMGINYPEALLLRDAGYRLWSGALDTPPWEFTVEP